MLKKTYCYYFMKSVHARKYIEFFRKHAFRTLFTFMVLINFYVSIINLPYFLLKLIGIFSISSHFSLQIIYFLVITFKTVANLILKVFYFDIFIEVWKQIFNLQQTLTLLYVALVKGKTITRAFLSQLYYFLDISALLF